MRGTRLTIILTYYCSLGEYCWTYIWWRSGNFQGRCMYFSLYDDWSHDRFNDKENQKHHGWTENYKAISGIKFFARELADQVATGRPQKHQRRPAQITPRNHFFQTNPSTDQVCPTWMKVTQCAMNQNTQQNQHGLTFCIMYRSRRWKRSRLLDLLPNETA